MALDDDFARELDVADRVRLERSVVAGAGRMDYKRFLFFNIFGGIGWVVSMILFGYFLTPVLQEPLKKVFGEKFEVQKNIEIIIILVVLVSIAPGLYAGFKAWLRKRKLAKAPKPANPVA